MPNNNQRRKKDSARLTWSSKPRRAPNPKDIDFQTAEIVIPNPQRDQLTIAQFRKLAEVEIDKTKMNRLIWGDNMLAMQALLASGYEGKINLIYIDPPFWSGEDYYANFVVEGKEVTKEPSVIERLAYKDIWAGGIDSYLDMLYPRLQLMKRLLAENGSIYVHADWHIGHYVKIIMDEIFGWKNFMNEIAWYYRKWNIEANIFMRNHDCILVYAKDLGKHVFNVQYISKSPKSSGQGRAWKSVFDEEGRRHSILLEEQSKGVPMPDVWEISMINPVGKERLAFPTQKPEKLLERIIKASSNEGDLVADFFPGSGTTLAVAEKLNRRWIGCDFSKVAIQIARNRLVSINAKPFLLENIGNYQRQMIYLHGGRIYEMQRIILKLYGATPRKDFQDMGVREAEDGVVELVYVSYPDRPVTAKKVEELAERADRLDGSGYRRLVILGWDYEYNYEEALKQRKRALGEKWNVEVVSKIIPPEVYEYLKRAKNEEELEPLTGKIFFHEKPYLRLSTPEIEHTGNKAEVTIGIQRYVIFDIPIEKEKERLAVAEIARTNFAALIDYWAVDWDYDGMVFKAMSQAFRGFGKRAKTVPVKMKKELDTGKEYTVAVRVIDIFGNDATATTNVNLREGG
ncbi:MAG: site-specific DNA-methyltransferase [Methanophagales archaeon]|nr:site-specific DNA-methyltransferase [Methanophagales archaeon]